MSYLGNSVGSQATQPATDFFSGNGVTTTFTLTRPVQSNYSVEVVVNNVQQNPSSTYSINASNQIVFVAPPSVGTNNIYVMYNGIMAQLNGVGQGTVGGQQLGSVSNINSIGSSLTLQTNGVTGLTIDQSQNIVAVGTAKIYGNTTIGNTDASAYGGKLSVFNAGQSTAFFWNSGVGSAHVGIGAGSSNLKLYNTYASGTLASGVGVDIDTVGRMVHPAQPFVSFYPSGITSAVLGSTDGSAMVQLTTANYLTLVDQVGGHWNGSAFTCPVAGMYQVSISGIKYPQAGVLHVDLRVNNVGYAGGNARNRAEETATYCQFGSTYILRCAAGDALTWWAFGAAGWHPGHGVWSIRLVG